MQVHYIKAFSVCQAITKKTQEKNKKIHKKMRTEIFSVRIFL